MNGLNPKMKNRIIIIIGTAIVAWIVFLTWLIFGQNSSIKAIEQNWDVKMPAGNVAEVYSISNQGFHGDGICYSVFDYSKNAKSAEKIEQLFSNTDIPTEEQIYVAEAIMDEIKVNADLRPDWEKCFAIYKEQDDGSELYMFYCVETKVIYILESFM